MNELTKQVEEIKSYLNTDKNDIQRQVTDNYINMVLRLNPNVRKSDVVDHVNLIQMSGANPFKRQVYFTSYKRKNDSYAQGTTVFSYRFFEDSANKTGEYEGCEHEVGVGEYFDPNTGETVKTLKATATVHRKGRAPLTFTAWYPEYVKTKYGGEPNSMWKSMPYAMLTKCAIAGALRSQFPETLGSFYVAEEMQFEEPSESIETQYKKVEENSKKLENKISELEGCKTKKPIIEAIQENSHSFLSGLDFEQTEKWMMKNLGVDSMKRLDTYTVSELKELLVKTTSMQVVGE